MNIGVTWKRYFSELKNGMLVYHAEGGPIHRVQVARNAVISKISLPDANHVFAIIAGTFGFLHNRSLFLAVFLFFFFAQYLNLFLENTNKYGFTTFYFSAVTQQEKQEWIHVAIQNGAHMLERYENPPSLVSLALLTPSGNKLSVDSNTGEITCLPKAVVTSVDNLFWMERRGPEEVSTKKKPQQRDWE